MEIIAESGTIFVALAVIFGLFMCWGVGANDLANAMGTSVGSKAISIKQAVVIAAVFEFAGAFLAGGHVTKTIRQGIIDSSGIVDSPEILIYGMLSALLAAGTWLMIASYRGWPVSTTHSIVGAIVGFALVGLGADAVQWNKIGTIVLSWLVSPLLGGGLAFGLMISVHWLILDTEAPKVAARRWAPAYLFLVGFVIALVTLFKGLAQLDIDMTASQSVLAALVCGMITSGGGYLVVMRQAAAPEPEGVGVFTGVERIFAPMMLFTACGMAFAHGSNDVANGIGPLAAVVSIVATGEVAQSSPLPNWILLLGGLGIVAGLATLGYKVIATVGEGITTLTPSRGFCAELAAACTVVIASRTGLPVSTTHVLVGCVIGVGLARGVSALDLRVIGQIIASWFITLPVGGALAAGFFLVLRAIFG